jgi:pimeloyl-ACP methyl ester carboxylesterase
MQAMINGGELHWREAGTGDPVLFIHGYPFDSTLWESQLAAVPAGWRFIAPDLRGFGKTPALNKAPLTMDALADDMIALLDHLGIKQAVICGLSMGGYVALSLVARHPERVRALVLVATRANADGPETQKNRHTLAARARREGAQPVLASMMPKLVSAHSRMKQPQIVEKVQRMIEGTPPETLARALEGMAVRKDYTEHLTHINVPTIVVRGELDEIIPAGDMELIARTVRGARHEVISLVAHLPNVEASDVFNKTLVQYLKFLPPTTTIGDMSLSF